MRHFYKTEKLSNEEIIKRARKAYELSFNWWVDKLDCNESYCRKKVDMDFEDVVSLFRKEDSVVRFFVEYPISKFENNGLPFCAIVFRIFGAIDYFLWIHFPVEHKDKFFGDLELM